MFSESGNGKTCLHRDRKAGMFLKIGGTGLSAQFHCVSLLRCVMSCAFFCYRRVHSVNSKGAGNMKRGTYSKALAMAVIAALGCGVMGSALAAETHDMTKKKFLSSKYKDYEVEGQVGDSYTSPDIFLYGLSGTTVKGGNIIVTSRAGNNNIFAALQVTSSDLTADTVNSVFDNLKEKYTFASGVAYNYHYNYATMQILDSDGDIARHAAINVENSNGSNKVTGFTLDGGVWKQVLVNDGTADQYDITQSETTVSGSTVAVNTLLWNKASYDEGYAIHPDLGGESVKAAVKGAAKDLYVTNTLGGSTGNNKLNITAEGGSGDTVYGIYNDKSGIVSVKAGKLNISAETGNTSQAIYAGNSGSAESKVVVEGTNANVLKAAGDVVSAGKNGVVEVASAAASFTTAYGNIFSAADGGRIHVGKVSTKTSEDGYVTKSGKAGITTSGISAGHYLALAETGGEIELGMDSESLTDVDYDKATVYASSHDVEGDVKTDATGKISLGVSGKKNYKGNAEGNVGIYLRDGAAWTGAALDESVRVDMGGYTEWNAESISASQHIKSMNGADAAKKRSYVTMGSGDLTIDSYAGNTTFVYQRDGTSAVSGGNITIVSAQPKILLSDQIGEDGEVRHNVLSATPSTIYLAAEKLDADSDASAVTVLNNLAAKLKYSAYANGERNLSGRVEILEGLTSSSVSTWFSDLTFDENGQAVRDSKLYDPYTGMIFGTGAESDYAGVISGSAENGDLTYDFTENTIINVKMTEDPRTNGKGALYVAAVNNWGDEDYDDTAAHSAGGPSYTLNMNGHDLDLSFGAYPTSGSTGSQPMWTAAAIAAYREGTITIEDPGAVSIESSNNYYYGSAIRATTAGATETGAHIIINNDATEAHAVKIRGGIDTPAYEMNWQAVYAMTQSSADKEGANTIEIKGLVDIETDKATALYAKGGYSKVSVGGGKINAKNYDAIWSVGENASVNVNVLEDADGNISGAGTNRVQIDGNAASTTQWYGNKGKIRIGLTTEDSYLSGHIYGTGEHTLWLQNGASWTNAINNYNNWSTGTSSKKSVASTVTVLHGGDSAANAGNIFQKETKDITIGTLDGYINVFLAHDSGTADFSSLGNVIVTNAKTTAGSNAVVSMITDNEGLDMTDSSGVNTALDALAQKLYYTAYTSGERNLDGYVKIADGLTASAAVKALGSIAFSETDGKGSLADESAAMSPTKMRRAGRAVLRAPSGYKTYEGYIGGSSETDWDSVRAEDGSYDFRSNTELTYTTEGGGMTNDSAFSYWGNNIWNSNVQSVLDTATGEDPDTGEEYTVSDKVTINMNDNALKITGDYKNVGSGLLAGDYFEFAGRGSVEILNPGRIEITVTNTVTSNDREDDKKAAALAALNGGSIHIANGTGTDLDSKIAQLRVSATDAKYGVVVLAANSNEQVDEDEGFVPCKNDIASRITIDGLVDILADGKTAGTAIAAAASNVDIGGGTIVAEGGATAISAGGFSSYQSNGETHTGSALKGEVNINVAKDSDGKITRAGDKRLTLKGDVATETTSVLDYDYKHGKYTVTKDNNGQINLGFRGSDSSWEGSYTTEQKTAIEKGASAETGLNVFLTENAAWTGDTVGTTALVMSKDAVWTGKSTTDELSMTIDTSAVWKPTAASKAKYMTGGTSEAESGIIDMRTDGAGDISIGEYSGFTNVYYSHANAGAEDNDYAAGNITVGSAAEGSGMTLITDNSGIDTNDNAAVEKTLNALARKLIYSNYDKDTNLSGKVQIASGFTASDQSLKMADVAFEEADAGRGSAVIKAASYTTGDYETLMMKGVRSATLSSNLLWRSLASDMYHRNASLREGSIEDGIWAKVLGGRMEYDANNANFKTNYWGAQVGYDRAFGRGWNAGVGIDYIDGDSDYILGGDGDNKLYAFGLYAGKDLGNGAYFDAAFKVGRIESDYAVYNEIGRKLEGDYKTTGYSLSMQYGKRFESGKSYVEPQAELTWARAGSKSYDAMSGSDVLHIDQASYNSLVGRLGFEAGTKSARGTFFGRVGIAHEFDGDVKAGYFAKDGGRKETRFDGSDTWAEVTLGGRYQLSGASLVFADFTRSFGGDYENRWKLNAGLRWSF